MPSNLLLYIIIFFFRRNIITAFVDNSCREEQETFFNLPIISPDEIVHYDMDFILIASSYDEEITKQIVDELHYDEKQILHMYDIYHFMYDFWETNLNLSKKGYCALEINAIMTTENHNLRIAVM